MNRAMLLMSAVIAGMATMPEIVCLGLVVGGGLGLGTQLVRRL